jgi:hypothetical protein
VPYLYIYRSDDWSQNCLLLWISPVSNLKWSVLSVKQLVNGIIFRYVMLRNFYLLRLYCLSEVWMNRSVGGWCWQGGTEILWKRKICLNAILSTTNRTCDWTRATALTDRRRHLLVLSCGCGNVRWILFRRQKLRLGALRLYATNRLCYDVW